MALLLMGSAAPSPLPETRWALTPPFHPYLASRGRPGGLFSVALSLAFPPPGVTRHHALWSSDFPPVLMPDLSVGPVTGDRLYGIDVRKHGPEDDFTQAARLHFATVPDCRARCLRFSSG